MKLREDFEEFLESISLWESSNLRLATILLYTKDISDIPRFDIPFIYRANYTGWLVGNGWYFETAGVLLFKCDDQVKSFTRVLFIV